MQDKSSVQQKVQALCDCFAETDPLTEMASVTQESDKDEAALKWLALAVLHGIDRNAEEIKLSRSADDRVKAIIEYRKRELPLSEDETGWEVMQALRQMTHIEGEKAKVRLALGIRDSSVEIVVKVKQEDGGEKITLEFPKESIREVAMRIAVFNGSPRVGGNTDLLLCEAITPMEYAGHDVVRFNLNLLNIKPCQDCGYCEKTGECDINDDMVYVNEAIRNSDRIVLASPIFFFGLSAQTKLMVDRCQPFWCEKYLLKRPIPEGPNGRKGLLILVGGMKKEIGVQCGEASALAFFRTVNVPEHETVSFLGVDAKGAIKERPGAFDKVYRAVRSLIDMRE